MSGLTPAHLARFRDLLGARGSDMGRLAEDIGVSRHHLSQIVNGHFQGANYWARIRACVTAAEWAELLHVEKCATWNKENQARSAADTDPDRFHWLQRRQCGECKVWEGFSPCVERQVEGITHGLCPKCYNATMDRYAAIPLEELRAPGHAYLVTTDDGLRVHHGAALPTSCDRELSAAFVSGDAHAAPIVCDLRAREARTLSPSANGEPLQGVGAPAALPGTAEGNFPV